MSEYIVSTPWDSKVFGINTFEIINRPEIDLNQVISQIVSANKPGHYTVKVDPLTSKKVWHDYNFYYCDTLIQPYCTPNRFICFQQEGIYISRAIHLDELIKICHGAFVHGRFHRDFNIDKNLADIRYDLWLEELYKAKSVFGLMHDDNLAGFFGFDNNKIVLHALSKEYRGKGMAKYFWSVACQELFSEGHAELISSISVSNVAALNLYSSLGFKFRNPLDAYHILIK